MGFARRWSPRGGRPSVATARRWTLFTLAGAGLPTAEGPAGSASESLRECCRPSIGSNRCARCGVGLRFVGGAREVDPARARRRSVPSRAFGQVWWCGQARPATRRAAPTADPRPRRVRRRSPSQPRRPTPVAAAARPQHFAVLWSGHDPGAAVPWPGAVADPRRGATRLGGLLQRGRRPWPAVRTSPPLRTPGLSLVLLLEPWCGGNSQAWLDG
ncbi:hypothetical protein U9M48_022599 [Paspalum notatum var. saurae]|uniref:Uncharacterized protein n=1 Tax=Paspalum notatum var. saurae TaxID=547442 RepID=A0AAQ3TJZ6_PASNO